MSMLPLLFTINMLIKQVQPSYNDNLVINCAEIPELWKNEIAWPWHSKIQIKVQQSGEQKQFENRRVLLTAYNAQIQAPLLLRCHLIQKLRHFTQKEAFIGCISF